MDTWWRKALRLWGCRAPATVGVDQAEAERRLLNHAMAAAGWHHMRHTLPPYGCLLELRRHEWPHPWVTTHDQIPPEMNAEGLWWRVAGDRTIDGEITP